MVSTAAARFLKLRKLKGADSAAKEAAAAEAAFLYAADADGDGVVSEAELEAALQRRRAASSGPPATMPSMAAGTGVPDEGDGPMKIGARAAAAAAAAATEDAPPPKLTPQPQPQPAPAPAYQDSEVKEDASRLIFFEKLFFMLDTQAKGFMHLSDAADLLSFTALGMSDQQVQDALRRADSVVGTRQNGGACGVSGPKSLVEGIRRASISCTSASAKLTSSSLKGLSGRTSPRLLKGSLSKLSASISSRRASRGKSGRDSGGGGETPGRGAASPPHPFMGSVASFTRAASLGTKRFADAMGSATMGEQGLAGLIKKATTPKPPSRTVGDGKLVRSEFVDLCIDVMWGLPVQNLEMAVQNYLGAKSMEKRRNAAYWQAYGRQIDQYSRFFVCVSYLIIMCFLFSIKFYDKYEDERTLEMFSGSKYVMINQDNVWVAIIFVCCFIGTLASYFIPRQIIKQRLKQYEREERERGH